MKHYYVLLYLLINSFLGRAQSGLLDLSFNSTGKVITSINGMWDNARKVALQPDDKIIICGRTQLTSSNDILLCRYLSNGSLDNTFDSDGIQTLDFAGLNDFANDLVIQSDGKILITGTSGTLASNTDAILCRFTSSGQLDTNFNSNGKVFIDFGLTEDVAKSIGIQNDGKIIIAGISSNSIDMRFFVARFNTNGSLDPTFGSGGKVVTTLVDSINNLNSLTIQSDGKITVCGTTNTSNDFILVRYQSNGILDNSFGSGGIVITDFGINGKEIGNSIVQQSDDKILVAGKSNKVTFQYIAVARYLIDGSLDNSFGLNGLLLDSLDNPFNEASEIKLQSDGKILVTGSTGTSANIDMALARYYQNGTRDNTLHADGYVTTDFGFQDDESKSFAIQSDGKIVLAGLVGQNKIGLLRYMDTPTGFFNQSSSENTLQIYPNPCHSNCQIILDENTHPNQIEIISILGTKVKTLNNIQGNKINLDCSDLQNGIYLIQLKKNNSIINQACLSKFQD